MVLLMDMTYYSAIIFIEIFEAIVMLFLMSNSMIFNKKYRHIFSLEFIILMIIVLTEWLNTFLDGFPHQYISIHYLVKFVEFSLTPALPAAVIIALAKGKAKTVAEILVMGNFLFLLISIPFGFVFYMDDNNMYKRGQGYPIFVLIYAVATSMLIWGIIAIGRKYQNSNNIVLWVGCIFAVSGIGIQLLAPDVRTSWLTVEGALIMSYLYLEGLIMQNDRLTSLLNRFAYEKHLDEIRYRTAIIVFDVDEFKSINDEYGHTAGDAALELIGEAIKKIFSKEGLCYRIGGDEFCVILKKKSVISRGINEGKLDELIEVFNKRIEQLKSDDPRITGVSIGYAFTDETETPNLTFQIADRNMYYNKEKRREQSVRTFK